jgi:hypothetical protein
MGNISLHIALLSRGYTELNEEATELWCLLLLHVALGGKKKRAPRTFSLHIAVFLPRAAPTQICKAPSSSLDLFPFVAHRRFSAEAGRWCLERRDKLNLIRGSGYLLKKKKKKKKTLEHV